MYVCLCNGITDKDIKKAAVNGCQDLKALRQQMDIANECGKCRRQACEILQESQLKNKDLLIASFA
ncbi:bacterioferritin-associated ferredoxin [Gayadomonas joobiniege]|uniref:bacterioferritin-associated ferredoxin n=1 Tax=Gayadomonas joobiniege TaxID=1234606 RepID=UPI000361D606|nr:bacterioferritin-associated ferredoxin [Gayadomonas joobiniege]